MLYPLLGFQSDRAGIDIDQLFMLLFLDFLQSFVQFWDSQALWNHSMQKCVSFMFTNLLLLPLFSCY